MKNTLFHFLLVTILILTNSCGLIDELLDHTNSLGGSTVIPLTEPGSVSDVYGTYNGQPLKNSSVTIKSRSDGIVTYKAVVDISQFPDSIKLKAITTLMQLSTYYKFDTSFTLTPDNKLEYEFKLKITSDGYMDYFTEGRPRVIGKYADGVDTKYTVKNDKGETLTRTVTEKTGLDDWPLGFILIKTSKIEENTPADNPAISKVIFRINHRFGLVYVEYQFKDGTVLILDIFAKYV